MRTALALVVLLGLVGEALGADTTPFFRIGDPYIFEVGLQPRQYVISKPKEATSYRFVNRCNVDVRIKKVESLDEQVTLETGTIYLARSVETVATSSPKFVSLMAMDDLAGKICKVELQYGTGN